MRFNVGRPARRVEDIDLSTATSATRTGPAMWVADGVLEIPFSRDLTQTEVDAVVLQLTSVSDDEAALREAAAQYLAITSPTTAQTTAQVKRLTRLLLGIYERRQ